MSSDSITYLGDAVYVDYQDWGITLMTNNHRNPKDTIVLENQVLNELIKFLKHKRNENARSNR